MLIPKIRAYMVQNGMWPENGRILCACSGGTDSAALLHLLSAMPELTVVCAHFNHGLRGAESDRDEAYVRGLAEGLHLHFISERGDVSTAARQRGMGIEEAARALRYDFLRRAAAETDCPRIATAHTADDNAETVLLRLLRGAGAAGLSGIRPLRADGVARPLLRTTRQQLEDYLRDQGLGHVEDSSNADPHYTRNALRSRVMPALRELNGAAVEHICAAAELLRSDAAYLDGLAQEFLTANPGSVPIKALTALPEPVETRVLQRLGGNPGLDHVRRAQAMCRSGRRWTLELPGRRLRAEGGVLYTDAPETPVSQPRRELTAGETLALPETGRWIVSDFTICSEEIHNSFNTFFFPCGKICGKITVASRAPGDRIRLLGRGCTKEVRRLFQEAGLTEAQRASRLVISDGAGPIAVEGFGVAERMRCEPGDRVLRMGIVDENTKR